MSKVAVAGKKDTILLPVDDLKLSFFVRKDLDQDRVLYFAELYESEAAVPPIEILHGGVIFDGRHRYEAAKFLNRTHVECKIVEHGEGAATLAAALIANFGGALPPSRSDTIFVIRQMLEAGVKEPQIKQLLAPPYPIHLVRRYTNDARSELNKVRLTKARLAVSHGGKTVEEAATENKLDPRVLQDDLAGVKKRRRAGGIAEIKGEMTTRLRAFSRRNNETVKRLIDKFEDGEVTQARVDEFFEHWTKLLRQAQRSAEHSRQRFEVQVGSVKVRA